MKTSELIGPALDWAVAKCEGHDVDMARGGWVIFDTHRDDPPPFNEYNDNRWHQYSPSTDWAQGGPIIEREKITLEWTGENWMGYIRHDEELFGPTPLVAAMRCYVASKLGDEIEVPEQIKG